LSPTRDWQEIDVLIVQRNVGVQNVGGLEAKLPALVRHENTDTKVGANFEDMAIHCANSLLCWAPAPIAAIPMRVSLLGKPAVGCFLGNKAKAIL
jgi:hypothetical protein